jgi:hypothetical protein
MFNLGMWLTILGGGSFVLNLVDMEFKLLMLIDMFGPLVGNCIRIGLITIGVALMATELILRRRASLLEASELSEPATTSQSAS